MELQYNGNIFWVILSEFDRRMTLIKTCKNFKSKRHLRIIHRIIIFIMITGDVGHIEKEENVVSKEECTINKSTDEDPHHILKHISQTQPVTTI